MDLASALPMRVDLVSAKPFLLVKKEPISRLNLWLDRDRPAIADPEGPAVRETASHRGAALAWMAISNRITPLNRSLNRLRNNN